MMIYDPQDQPGFSVWWTAVSLVAIGYVTIIQPRTRTNKGVLFCERICEKALIGLYYAFLYVVLPLMGLLFAWGLIDASCSFLLYLAKAFIR